MKLRGQVLTLSLATVLVPWFGWKLVQELESFLRAGQESALLASARTVALAIPVAYQSELSFGRSGILHVRPLSRAPVLDGYDDDWLETGSSQVYASDDGELRMELLAGQSGGQLFLFVRVNDSTRVHASPGPNQGSRNDLASDGLLLSIRSARGLTNFRIPSSAPGPLLITSTDSGGGQIEGYWQESDKGYNVELALPTGDRSPGISIGAQDARQDGNIRTVVRDAGTLSDGRATRWLTPTGPSDGLESWLASVIPEGSRAWIVDRDGWVVADTGALPPDPAPELTWIERAIYRMVAGSGMEEHQERPERVVRFSKQSLEPVMDGELFQRWSQEPDTAEVHHTAAVPLELAGNIKGLVMLESRSEGLLLVTNRALGRLLFTTLLLTLVLATGLWFFATRLSRRVQRLSGAVSEAMDDAAHPPEIPLRDDRDELGELARNNARLLRMVSEYTAYLQKLAGRLSHELKTPLAITRSSLDNLADHVEDEDGERYLSRAREGTERQAAIVRAMSEANRLEASVSSADWEVVDLSALLTDCVEAYRGIHVNRRIELKVPERAACRCAPDLLTQALDKLVDNALSLAGDEDLLKIILEPKGNWCHIKVFNTGTRLPETLQDQLFDSLVSVRKPGTGGLHLGLGLYIVRLVAEAHEGRVEARNVGDSPDGAGVVFTLSLPAS